MISWFIYNLNSTDIIVPHPLLSLNMNRCGKWTYTMFHGEYKSELVWDYPMPSIIPIATMYIEYGGFTCPQLQCIWWSAVPCSGTLTEAVLDLPLNS